MLPPVQAARELCQTKHSVLQGGITAFRNMSPAPNTFHEYDLQFEKAREEDE